MSLFKKFFRGFFVLFLISATFLYFNMEDVVYYLNAKRAKTTDEVSYKYLEVPEHGSSYVYNDVIYTLDGEKFTGLSFDGEVLYERVLDGKNFTMNGIGDKIFISNHNQMIILDDENHLIKKLEGKQEIDGLKPLEDGYVVYSRDEGNYLTTIFDNDMNMVHEYVQKDATVDVNVDKNFIEVLNIKKSETGLSTVINKISDDKSETILELSGYVPYKFFGTKSGYLIATDKELIYYDGKAVENKISYENFGGFYQLKKYYCLFADNYLYILRPNLEILKKEELKGFDNIRHFSDKVLIFTTREFLVVGDEGILSRTKTDQDIVNMYGEKTPVVEFRNGFIIY